MRIIKFIVYSLLGILLLLTCCAAIFWNLENTDKNKIASIVTNKALKYFRVGIQVGSTSIDLNNKEIIFHVVETDIDEIKILSEQIKLKYALAGNKLKLNFSLDDPIINNAKVHSKLEAQYLGSLNLQKNDLLSLNIFGEKQQGSCNIEITDKKINLSSCNFNINESAIKLSGDVGRNNNTWSYIKIDTDFEKLKLSSYKFLKTITSPNKTFLLLDELAVGGLISGNLKINIDAENKFSLTENNLSGEINFQDVKLKYDPDFPIVQNVNAKAIIKENQLKCEIFNGNSENLQIQQGDVSFAWLGKDSVINVTLSVKGPTTNINYFINDKQKLTLKNKGINFSTTKGTLAANVKVAIPIAEEIPTTIDIQGSIENFYLNALANKIELIAPKLNFTIDSKSLKVECDGSLNKYATTLKYEQNMPYTNATLTAKIKLENLNSSPEPLIQIEGREFLNIVYKNSINGYKIAAIADLSNVGIKMPKFGFTKNKGDKCLVDLNNDKSMDDMQFKIYGGQNLDIKGSFNLNTNILTLKSINTDSLQKVNGKLQLKKDQIICDLSGKYANLENYDLFNFFKKKQDKLEVIAALKFNKIKLKNNIEVSDIDFRVKCDTEKCFEGKGDAHIENKKITAVLDSSSDSEEKWHIKSQNVGMLLRALGMYSNIKNGQMDLVISTKRNILKIGQVPNVIKGTLAMNDFTVTKTPFMANFLSLLSLSPEQIFSQEIKFNKLDTSFAFENNIINILDCNINGTSFDLIFKGNINLNKREIKLNGATFPSMYGINTVLKNTPIIGKILYSKKRKGIIFTPFSISEKY
jgi:hypothetical protein